MNAAKVSYLPQIVVDTRGLLMSTTEGKILIIAYGRLILPQSKPYIMALILPVRGIEPIFGENCYLAPNATVVGEVTMGDNCSVWFNAVVRGDVNSIQIGNNCNVQDGAVLHCTYKRSKIITGDNVSIAHNATVHGCIIEDDVLIGMNSVVMDNARVERGSIVAAGAIVLANTIVESGYIYAGAPAKKIKLVGEEMSSVFERTATNYIKYAKWFSEGNMDY